VDPAAGLVCLLYYSTKEHILTPGGVQNLEEIVKDKWIQLQDSLEKARDVGLAELTVSVVCAS
jgi:hypothetical protein